MCCSSMRSTGYRVSSRSCSTRRWRTSRSTSSWTRGSMPAPCGSRSAPSRWWAPPRGPECSPRRCASASGSSTTWTSTPTRRSASILGASVEPAGAEAIARRSRGTPRIANRLLRRVRDYAQVKGDGVVTGEIARRSLDAEGVDGAGLDRLDRRFLSAIIEQFNGGPAGLEAIAATINDEAETLAEVVEPFLLKIGFVVRTPNGRKATPAAYAHLRYAAPPSPGGQTQLPLQ